MKELINQEEQFKTEAKIIDFKYEYHGYKGEEKFIIVTPLTKEELMDKYSDIVQQYIPFILLSPQHGEVIDEFHKNNHKHEMRLKRHCEPCDINNSDFFNFHLDLAYEEDFLEMMILKDKINQLHIYLERLNEVERRRIHKYFFEDKSMTQIGNEEGVSHTAVRDTLVKAKKKLKNFFENDFQEE